MNICTMSERHAMCGHVKRSTRNQIFTKNSKHPTPLSSNRKRFLLRSQNFQNTAYLYPPSPPFTKNRTLRSPEYWVIQVNGAKTEKASTKKDSIRIQNKPRPEQKNSNGVYLKWTPRIPLQNPNTISTKVNGFVNYTMTHCLLALISQLLVPQDAPPSTMRDYIVELVVSGCESPRTYVHLLRIR